MSAGVDDRGIGGPHSDRPDVVSEGSVGVPARSGRRVICGACGGAERSLHEDGREQRSREMENRSALQGHETNLRSADGTWEEQEYGFRVLEVPKGAMGTRDPRR